MNYVHACNENNAIKVVAFAFEFTREVSDKVIEDFINIYENDSSLKEKFQEKKPHQGITIKIDDTGQQVSHSALSGVTLESIKNDILEWTFQFRNDAVIVTCSKYTSWNEIWSESRGFFEKVLNIVKEQEIRLVGIEYIDEFIVSDNLMPWKQELFKVDSKYIPSYIFDNEEFWHVHQGFLLTKKEPIDFKLLTNLNIDFKQNDGSEDHFLYMRTQHKSIFLESKKLNELFTDIDKIFEISHNLSKEMMNNLLSEEMLDNINLKVAHEL